MEISIFYFSGTGNTKDACDHLKKLLDYNTNSVTLYKIENFKYEDINEITSIIQKADIVGLAYPVYGANLPKIVETFIQYLSFIEISNKKIFILSTVGYINAYGPFIIKRILKKYGLVLNWHYVYKTVNNTSIRKINTKLLNEKYNKQVNQFEKFCNLILNNKKYYNGIGPWIIGGYFIRNILRKPISSHYRKIFVDTNICTKCNLCVINCPMNAIIIENDTFKFLEKCTTCFRCINKCPVEAIKKRHA